MDPREHALAVQLATYIKPGEVILASNISAFYKLVPSARKIGKRFCARYSGLLCWLEDPARIQSLLSPTLVATERDAKAALRTLETEEVVSLDIEGDLTRHGRLSLVSLATRSRVFVFDVLRCPAIVALGLGALLSKKGCVKIVHDCRNDAGALRGQFGVELGPVFDTQIAHSLLRGDSAERRIGLNAVLRHWLGVSNSVKDEVDHREPGLWEQRPLPGLLLEYSWQDVMYGGALYAAQRAAAVEQGLLKVILEASARNTTRIARRDRESLGGNSEERAPRQTARELLGETAKAFLAFAKDGGGELLRQCRDRDVFRTMFEQWKDDEARAGRTRRGGASAVAKLLVRRRKLKLKKRALPVEHVAAGDLAARVKKAGRATVEADKGGVVASRPASARAKFEKEILSAVRII